VQGFGVSLYQVVLCYRRIPTWERGLVQNTNLESAEKLSSTHIGARSPRKISKLTDETVAAKEI